MLETGNNIRIKRNFIDESYRGDRPEGYDLFIYADEYEFSCTVAERGTKEFVAIEAWEFKSDFNSFDHLLQDIFSTSTLLQSRNFRRVICCSGFRNSTLIPNPLFDPSTAEEQLKFSNNINPSDEIITDELRQVEARNVFSVPVSLYNRITTKFPNAEIHHTSTSLIEYLLSVNRNSASEILTINIHINHIEILASSGKEILLYNHFDFESPEEMVYYILFVCEQLHLNPENVEVQFTGDINVTDSAYTLTHKYIRHTGLVSRPENYRYCSGFDTFPSHYHFNLFSQLVCAL